MLKAGDPMPQLSSLWKDLKQETLEKWAWRALRAAFMEWRDRRRPPGVAARFRRAGERFYGFKGRTRLTTAEKLLYVGKGTFRDQLLRRKPKRRKGLGKGQVGMSFSLGGGVMNLLGSITPTAGVTRSQTSVIVNLPGVSVDQHERRTPSGSLTTVSAYRLPAREFFREVATVTVQKAAESWRDQFGWDRRDETFIAMRFRAHMHMILRKAAVSKKGKLKATFVSNHLREHDRVAA